MPLTRRLRPRKISEMSRQGTSYFWGEKNVPLLYLFFPLLMVSLDLELVMFFPKINPTIIEASMIIPTILIGVLLLKSAMKFKIESAENQPIHYITRWKRVRTISDIALIGSGLLALYEIVTRSNVIRGNLLQIFIEALGVLYLICLYTMLLPLRFWSPRPTYLARMYLMAMPERTDAEVGYLESALRWFSRSYAKSSHLRLRQRVFANALGLDHAGRRNLALRLRQAIVSGNYEDGVQALIASINTAREAVLTDRETLRDTLTENDTGKVVISALVGLAALLVIYLSAVVLGPNSVGTFRSEIGLLLLGVITLAAIVWAGLRRT
jgi:hypothetical protein